MPEKKPRNHLVDDDDLIRLDEVVRKTTLSETEVYRLMREGTFPLPLRLSRQVTAWRVGDIREWNRSHTAATELGPRARPDQPSQAA